VDELVELLRQLKEGARLPLESAQSLPASAYCSPAFLSREVERIFRREWICAGRADEIPQPGDWFCFDLVGEPIIVVRDEGGEIRALSNVCAHRFALLKSGRGNSSTLQCPYHAWTYDCQGRLRAAPFMEQERNFVPSEVRLPQFRVETWLGFIFVNLDVEASPLRPRLSGLETQLAEYPVAETATVVHEIETWNANWKVVLENAMESYHIFRVHKKTLNHVIPTRSIECFSGGEAYNLHTTRSTLCADVKRGTVWQAAIYPSLVIYVGPLDHMRMSWLTVLPERTGLSRVTTGQALPDPPPRGSDAWRALFSNTKAGNDTVNAEDRPICESVQRGVVSARTARGRLSHLEAPLWEFSHYLGRKLA
jgi:phenylpropionate dioxygenase-like ring-hydroxylating dioxygenase large terminal subunit